MMTRKESTQSLAVEKERTKRYFALLLVGGVIAVLVVVLFFTMFRPDSGGKGSIEITKDGIKVNLEQPLINQVDSSAGTIQVENKRIVITKGRFTPQIITSIQQQTEKTFSPSHFVGSNLIDVKGGFVLAGHDSDWVVVHDTTAYATDGLPIITLTSKHHRPNGSVRVSRFMLTSRDRCTTIACIADSVGLAYRKQGFVPSQSTVVDGASATAFLFFYNPRTKQHRDAKIVATKGCYYTAVATYADINKEPIPNRNSALAVVATFAVID